MPGIVDELVGCSLDTIIASAACAQEAGHKKDPILLREHLRVLETTAAALGRLLDAAEYVRREVAHG